MISTNTEERTGVILYNEQYQLHRGILKKSVPNVPGTLQDKVHESYKKLQYSELCLYEKQIYCLISKKASIYKKIIYVFSSVNFAVSKIIKIIFSLFVGHK